MAQRRHSHDSMIATISRPRSVDASLTNGYTYEVVMSTMDIHDYGIYLCVSDPQCFRRWMPSTIPVLPQWVWLDSSVPGTSPSISSHSRLPLQLQLGVRWFANLVRWPLSLPTCWQRSWMKQVSGRWVASSTQDFALILHCRKEFFAYTPWIYFLTSKWKPTQMSTVVHFLFQCSDFRLYPSSQTFPVLLFCL